MHCSRMVPVFHSVHDNPTLDDATPALPAPDTYSRLEKMEHGCRMVYAGFPSFFGLELEDRHVPTFWLSCIASANTEQLEAHLRVSNLGPSYDYNDTHKEDTLIHGNRLPGRSHGGMQEFQHQQCNSMPQT